MLHTAMPMPGVLRLRALHPLIEGDGSCALIYDLERAAVVEVPEELQFHVASALEMGDLDEALVGWLILEDLLTGVGECGWSARALAAGPPEAAVWWSPGAIYWIDDELHARIDPARESSARELIAFALEQSTGHGRVRIHLSWGGSYPGHQRLEQIVVETCRLAGPSRPEISFELTLDAGEVTLEEAEFLAGYPVQIRLLCGSYPAPRPGAYGEAGPRDDWRPGRAVRLLLDHLGDRLTVHCVLDRGRLLDLWEWAKQVGIRHLDATVLEDSVVAEGGRNPGRLRELRNDLMAVCEEMADALAAQHLPVDYEPLTRIVDRLMRSEPMSSAYGELGGSGLSTMATMSAIADAYPRSLLDSFDLRLPELWDAGGPAGDAEVETPDFPCQGCWARHACSHSVYVASVHESDDPWELSEDRCSLWRTEVEVALHFYHRLAHTDPLQVRKFFDDASREPAPVVGLREELGPLRMPS
jgi:hypothetical protein